ncbi:MAG: YqgE/AlgH family protein [Bryobacteraceae bacterium]|jgi:putative transcriptional regulator
MALRDWFFCVLAALACAPSLAAQSTSGKDLAAGKFLVASRDTRDPNFMETVVLLVQFQQGGVVGLVINRRTTIPISRALSAEEAKGRPDPIYIGGPVQVRGIMALARSSADVAEAKHVFGDVYLITTKSLLNKSLASPIAASAFHVFLGYAGWSGPQLGREMELGRWYVFPGDSATVFDTDPNSVWDRLIEKTETRLAMSILSLTPHGEGPSSCRTFRR